VVIDQDPATGKDIKIDCTKLGSGAWSIPSRVEHLRFQTKAKFVLAVETASLFQRLVHHRYYETANCVIISMSGVPTRACRRFIRRLADDQKCPVLAFTDGDPYGYCNIYRTLKVGSGQAAHINRYFCVPTCHYLGVTPQDILDYDLEDATHPLEEADIKRAKDALKNDPFILHHKEWQQGAGADAQDGRPHRTAGLRQARPELRPGALPAGEAEKGEVPALNFDSFEGLAVAPGRRRTGEAEKGEVSAVRGRDERDPGDGRDASKSRVTSVPCVPSGGARRLSEAALFQKAQIVDDATVRFCDRFFSRRDRTHDQLVQAAPASSIVEGSQIFEGALKLTNVARASLEELLTSGVDFVRRWPGPAASRSPASSRLDEAAGFEHCTDVVRAVRLEEQGVEVVVHPLRDILSDVGIARAGAGAADRGASRPSCGGLTGASSKAGGIVRCSCFSSMAWRPSARDFRRGG
jgi:hypothetical protein